MEKVLPNKDEAGRLATYALANGTLIKQPCEVCNSKKSEMHHADYSKPLEVMWLCKEHNEKWHTKHPKLEGYRERIMIPVSAETHAQIKREAKEMGLTMNDYLEFLFENYKNGVEKFKGNNK